MRSITRCPSCQTQFFVTEVQLNKHQGKVRCGQCLHVFNAQEHFIETAEPSTEQTPVIAIEPPQPTPVSAENDHPPAAKAEEKDIDWPSISNELLSDDKLPDQELEHIAEVVELSASRDDIEAFTAESAAATSAEHESTVHDDNNDDRILLEDGDFDNRANDDFDNKKISDLNEITKLTFVADNQANYFDDLAKQSKRSTKKTAKNTNKNKVTKPRRWPWFLGVLILLLAAIAQTIYFLRDEIAIYYPNAKPYLLQACQKLNCSVSLPQQIEFILIDDSDMQEDEKHAGLMHFSSSLINKATFTQAYPSLELTLTDTDDNPILRRLFKPHEYLPTGADIALGLRAGDEIKIKLALTTQNVAVAGYRVYVTY